jgi:plastocyanin domain-containing protein
MAGLAEASGVQEVQIRVKGNYDPDVIVIKRGRPVRLHFNHQESALCSKRVIFGKIGQSAELSKRGIVTIEFTLQESGEIPFQYQ